MLFRDYGITDSQIEQTTPIQDKVPTIPLPNNNRHRQVPFHNETPIKWSIEKPDITSQPDEPDVPDFDITNDHPLSTDDITNYVDDTKTKEL